MIPLSIPPSRGTDEADRRRAPCNLLDPHLWRPWRHPRPGDGGSCCASARTFSAFRPAHWDQCLRHLHPTFHHDSASNTRSTRDSMAGARLQRPQPGSGSRQQMCYTTSLQCSDPRARRKPSPPLDPVPAPSFGSGKSPTPVGLALHLHDPQPAVPTASAPRFT
nr:hypothetical protein CFP56_00804 [Quercus suber]